MKLWLDNTGFHSVEKCLSKAAKNEVDVQSFLQYASYYAYSDSVNLNGFESESIREHTLSAQSLVCNHADSAVRIDITDVEDENTEAIYKQACLMGADEAAKYLRAGVNIEGIDIDNLIPIGVDPSNIEKQTRLALDVMSKKQSIDFEEIGKYALGNRAVGAFDYMIAASEPLRERFVELGRELVNPKPEEVYFLSVLCRNHLNRMLAHLYGCFFAPALGRAKVLRKYNNLAVKQIEKTPLEAMNESIDAVSNEIRKRLDLMPSGLPSIQTDLIIRSKGEPGKLIEEASNTYEAYRAAANKFSETYNDFDVFTIKGLISRNEYVEEFRNTIRRDLGLAERTRWTDAVKFTLALGVVPSFKIDPKELEKWRKEVVMDKKFSVFSDLIDGPIEDIKSTPEWGKLIKNCIRTS